MSHFLRIRTSEIADTLKKEISSYSPLVAKINELAVNGVYKSYTYNFVSDFVDSFASRVSGSQELEDSIDYLVSVLRKEGLDNVHTEDVVVPHWERGEESATLNVPRAKKLAMLGLGGSVGTPPEGITAEVLVVKSFAELQERAEEAKGKIVVYNQDFISYHETMEYCVNGAIKAGEVGAVATLIRSVAPFSMNNPHASWQNYSDDVPKIPAACITIEDAELLGRIQRRIEKALIEKTQEPKLEITLKMGAMNLPMATSRNIVAEVIGSVNPEQVVIVSGHLDGWDVGQGALDAAGAFVSWSVLSVIKALELKPRRTLRAVMWTGGEQGIWGAKGYYTAHHEELQNYNIVMEASIGTFQPTGVAFSGSDDAAHIMQEVLKQLAPLGAAQLTTPAKGGDDIEIFSDIPKAVLQTRNDKYYWFHNSEGDTLNVLSPEMMDLCTAAWTTVAFILADLTDPLPRS